MSESPSQMNPFGIASLVLGILSFPCLCFCYGFPFNALAIVLGIVALVHASNDASQGKGLAYGGIGLGILSMLCAVLMFVFALGSGVMSSMMQDF